MAEGVEAILSTTKPTLENAPQELEPRRLPLSEGAREILRQYYEAVEKEQVTGQLTRFASPAKVIAST